jgi:hypothetical protein
MKPRTVVLLIAAVAFTPAITSAQEDDLARLRPAFSDPQMQRMEAVLGQAASDGIPRSLLVDKAVEGVAKGMRAEVVLGAVSQLALELRVAVRLLGPGVDVYGLEKAADALRHGVSGAVVGSLAEEHPREFPVLLQAIEDLLHEGVALAEAQAVVREASTRGYGGDQVLTLPAAVRRLIRDGASPAQAASSVRQNLRLGRPIVPPSPGLTRELTPRPPPLRTNRPRPGG